MRCAYAEAGRRIGKYSQLRKSHYVIHLHRKGNAHMNMAIPHRERKHILLVEDHEDDRDLVAVKLPEYKFTFARDSTRGCA